MTSLFRNILVPGAAGIAAGALQLAVLAPAWAETSTDFEPAGFVAGQSVDDLQPDGTTIAPPMSFGNSCREAWFVPTAATDEEIVDLGSDPHGKVWRMSTSVSSGPLGQSPHSPRNSDIAGESPSLPNDACGPSTTQSYYAEFEFNAATGAAQSGMRMLISANSSDTRQATIELKDSGSGFDVGYYSTGDGCTFPFTEVATGLSYDWHRIGVEIQFNPGLASGTVGSAGAEGNDVVNVYVDNVLSATSTTWESCVGARVVDQILFETRDENTDFAGGGFYFDNVLVTDACPDGHCQAIDHYACYDVQELSRLPRTTVTLRDQFGPPEDQDPDTVRVGKAQVLCTPVDKNGEGIIAGDLQLVCYDTYEHNKADENVKVSNQFGEQKLRVKQRVAVCVPSTQELLPGHPGHRHHHVWWQPRGPHHH